MSTVNCILVPHPMPVLAYEQRLRNIAAWLGCGRWQLVTAAAYDDDGKMIGTWVAPPGYRIEDEPEAKV